MKNRDYCYILLITQDSLKKSQIKNWFDSVISNGPPGILSSTHINNKNATGYYKFIHEKSQEKHYYIAVLCRDLGVDEAQKIVMAWNRLSKDIPNWMVDFSQYQHLSQQKTQLMDEAFDELVRESARQYHTKWYHEMQDAGWQYATKTNPKKHVHAMLLPWDQLAEKYQKQSIDTVLSILNSFDDMNLQLTRKSQ